MRAAQRGQKDQRHTPAKQRKRRLSRGARLRKLAHDAAVLAEKETADYAAEVMNRALDQHDCDAELLLESGAMPKLKQVQYFCGDGAVIAMEQMGRNLHGKAVRA